MAPAEPTHMRHVVASALGVLSLLLLPISGQADLLTPTTILTTWMDAYVGGEIMVVSPTDAGDVLLRGILAGVHLQATVGGGEADLGATFTVTGGRLAAYFGDPGDVLTVSGSVGHVVNPATGVHGFRSSADAAGDVFADAALLTPDAPLKGRIRKLLLHGHHGRMVLAPARHGQVDVSAGAAAGQVTVELRMGRVRLDLGRDGHVRGLGAPWRSGATHGVATAG